MQQGRRISELTGGSLQYLLGSRGVSDQASSFIYEGDYFHVFSRGVFVGKGGSLAESTGVVFLLEESVAITVANRRA